MSFDVKPQEKLITQIDAENKTETDKLSIILGTSLTGSSVLVVILIIVCLCKIRRARSLTKTSSDSSTIISTNSISTIPTEDRIRTTQDVARRYERSVSSISSKSQVYLVPFSVLPSDFDYSSRDVTVQADFVILTDLSILEKCNHNNNINNSSESDGYFNEAYQHQESYYYNPYVYVTIPPLEREELPKKPSAYNNPTFYG